MNKENLLWSVLLAAVFIGLLFTLSNFLASGSAKNGVQGLPSKCIAPAGYSQEQWTEHLGHHPDQYAECFQGNANTNQPAVKASSVSEAELQDAINKVIPRGVPDVYGSELGVSFEDPVNSMNKLGQLENSISLDSAGMKRYIEAVSKISCEFCCGVPSIIDRNGNPACGCAHSGAMRGLAKYLLKNHGAEYSNDQLLQELVKWKTLFFPQQMVKRFAEQGKVW